MKPMQFVQSGDIELAVYGWGAPAENKPVLVCVHGFPDSGLFWAPVAERLARDYFVVSYDVRGAGLSTPVTGRRHYAYRHLVDDLAAVIDAVSPQHPVHLVGHDWGALQGWDAIVSARLRGRIASFSTAAPSLDQVGFWFRRRLLRPTPRNLGQFFSQSLRNAFMVFFNLPLLPELLLRAGLGITAMRKLLLSLDGLILDERPGLREDSLRALGIYRANLLPHVLFPKQLHTDLPVQLLVATRDPFIPAWLFERSEEWAPNLRRDEIDGSHWAPLSQADEFARVIREFVAAQHAQHRRQAS